MTTGKKIILALAVIALLIGAWFVAYHNHKSTSNLPQLSAIALMDEADVNELLVGYYRTQLPDVWGGPDPELSGQNTWVWKIDQNTLLTVSSNKVGERAKIVSTSVDSVFIAEVLEIGNGYILVKPLDGTREAASSDRIEVPITDGDIAYIVIGVAAPEGVSLEPRIVDGSLKDRFNPGNLFPMPEEGEQDVISCSAGMASASGNYQYSQSFKMVEDGDGLPNTKNWVFTLKFLKFDSTKATTISDPFGSDIEWYIHIENVIREYEDEEYLAELMKGKYAGQTDVMFTSEETQRLHAEEILAEGTWDFTVNFGESGEGVELLNQPITTMASIFRKTGPEIWDYEHVVDDVKVTSFVLRPLSATIYYECDDGANFTDHKEMRMYAVMKDGSKVELEDYGSGGVGFAVLTANAPIIIENVDYILLADGVRIDMP